MKKQAFAITLLALFAILPPASALADSWHIETVDSGGWVGWISSIALDSGDKPHISYLDYSNKALKYAYWSGSAWFITSVDTAGNVGPCTSIALDSSENPHISYYDDTNEDLKYAYWSGSAWSITSVDTAGVVGWHTSIALYSSDNPHISYFDNSNDDLKYARYDPEPSINLVTFSATPKGDGVLILN